MARIFPWSTSADVIALEVGVSDLLAAVAAVGGHALNSRDRATLQSFGYARPQLWGERY